MTKILTIEGMMCVHCQKRVQKALAALDGVKDVTVDLEKKQASVTMTEELSDTLLCDTVKEAGYTPTACCRV